MKFVKFEKKYFFCKFEIKVHFLFFWNLLNLKKKQFNLKNLKFFIILEKLENLNYFWNLKIWIFFYWKNIFFRKFVLPMIGDWETRIVDCESRSFIQQLTRYLLIILTGYFPSQDSSINYLEYFNFRIKRWIGSQNRCHGVM